MLQEVRAGELAALADLYDCHGPPCLELAGQLRGDAAAAEDAVFAVFLHLWREPPDDAAALREWLLSQTEQAA